MKKIITSLVCLALLSGIVKASRWSKTGDVITKRSGQENAVLTDGRVMAISGMAFSASGAYLSSGEKSYEIFSPATGKWTQGTLPAGGDHRIAMLLPNGNIFYVDDNAAIHIYDPHVSAWTNPGTFGVLFKRTCGTLLKDGRMLVVNYKDSLSQDCALYDWQTGAITPTGRTNSLHGGSLWSGGGAEEILLPDGKVLIVGGRTDRACEVYDPLTEVWTTTGAPAKGRGAGVAIYLRPPWNKVLVAGGFFQGAETELWNGTSWSYTGNLNATPRSAAAIVLIPDGRALIMGGSNDRLPMTALKTCELYDPNSGVWSLTDPFNEVPHGRTHLGAAVLYTGRVLAISGHDYVYVRDPDVIYEVTKTCEIYDPSDGVVDARRALNTARAKHTATLLPIIHTQVCSTNILVAGGENAGGFLKSCELHNYDLNATANTGDLNVARSCHAAILLPSGKMLVAGGKSSSGALRSCELYTASTESWGFTGNLNSSRFDHTATLLKNGDVLVTGGESVSGTHLGSCEVYSGGMWMPLGGMTSPRTNHTVVLLLDGRVLAVGGRNSSGVLDSCEIWNGAGWSPTGNLATGRHLHTTVLLQSGKVLAIGGMDTGGIVLSSCEIFDPSTGIWSSAKSLNRARYCHNTVLLYSGLILATGGHSGVADLQEWEVGDPATGEWKLEGPGGTGRHCHTSVLVGSDKPYVIMIGGKQSSGTYLGSIDRYDVGLGYQPNWQSTITSHQRITPISSVMDIMGTLFREYSEADGGNHCHIVSSDHPIISLVRVGGGNWQGNGGGQLMYMPLSHYWDETHTNVDLPDTDPGYYRLWSIVNGIPCSWHKVCEDVEESQQSTVHSPRLTVYPNPSTSGVGVQFRLGLSTMDSGPSTLKIHDLAGRLVRSLPIHHSPLTIHQLTPGIYFYRATIENSETQGKFVIID
jgi:hypothetical protein